MLVWATWLAFSCVRWAKWAWSCFSFGGYWVQKKKKDKLLKSDDKTKSDSTSS